MESYCLNVVVVLLFYLVHTTQARVFPLTYGLHGIPVVHCALVWYISAPSVLDCVPGRACASLSTHTYIVRPLWPLFADISHPLYSVVHPPGHWSVPGIMS